MTPIVIEYKDFPEEIQISAKRRATHFRKGQDSLPKKYLSPGADDTDLSNLSLGEFYTWKKHGPEERLWDTRMKQFVIKNPLSASKPRFVTIAGNDIMRMHEHMWSKIILILNDYFIQQLGEYSHSLFDDKEREQKIYHPKLTIPQFPINIQMEIHTFPRYGNWDLSNLWIYNKCFEDALQEAGVIPNDDIRRITQPGAPKFIPISREEDRKIIFRITPEEDRRILQHLMYYSMLTKPAMPPGFFESFKGVSSPLVFFGKARIVVMTNGKAGDLIINRESNDVVMNVNLGKDLRLFGKGFAKIKHQCYQLNAVPEFSQDIYNRLKNEIKTAFLDDGIPVRLRPYYDNTNLHY